MNQTETAALLTLCARYDQRTLGTEDVHAWHDVLGDVDAADAIAAVKAWYRDHRERITPADVRAGVRLIRKERLERNVEDEPPDADPDDVAAYLQALRSGRQQSARELRPRPVHRALETPFRRPPRGVR